MNFALLSTEGSKIKREMKRAPQFNGKKGHGDRQNGMAAWDCVVKRGHVFRGKNGRKSSEGFPA